MVERQWDDKQDYDSELPPDAWNNMVDYIKLGFDKSVSPIELEYNIDAKGHDIINLGTIVPDYTKLDQVTVTPTDVDIGLNNTMFYSKGDGKLYKKSYGGNEIVVGEDTTGSLSGLTMDTDKDWSGNNITNLGSSGYDVESQLDSIADTHTFSTSHISYDSGTTNQEIKRYNLQSGEKFVIHRMEMTVLGGSSVSNVYVDVYDESTDTVIGSVSAGSVDTTQTESDTGNVILIRVNNNSAEGKNLSTEITNEIV